MPRPSATTGLGKTTFVSVALLACFLSCAHLAILSTTRRMDGSTTTRRPDFPPSDFLAGDDARGGPVESSLSPSSRRKDREVRRVPSSSSSSSSSRKKDREVRRVASSSSTTTTTTTRPPPPTNIYLLGERNSGTNYAAGVLRDAFDPPNAVDGSSRVHEYFSSDVPVLRHKHMFRHSLLSEIELREIRRRTDALWILVVRRPCDWAEAMKRAPWHLCMPRDISSECPGAEFVGFEHFEQLRNYTLAEFFGMEWGDWPESTNFRNLSFVSEEFTYRNIFHLRRHKLKLMTQIVDAVPRNVKIVRLNELELSPEMFIKASMSACVHFCEAADD
ncbi:hypothetical protein ACHAW5_002476 [Stephanodiscus triporus]|uniref:Sulfotransferase domain-containing protein n=1 Tax=Stephanodiscus triporus TaxID=2934178 RepID=A0ABD3QKP5_9STRA